ncbi:RNA polymerase sigma factor [Aminipila luticellarii]|uniref:Sigma-70 family RNA polymerase sigma factor n=1 Tax=Aminipila luticellarii TaxID=2507160 RepID=A0A410PTX7_9FIRM|nr:sigma-70 family RNA polymerase sigma factor [Aminipila luticellarii]QAT42336.1 sigma-70 family RNA polymerase sigma factor [Aminipila luticellarii]
MTEIEKIYKEYFYDVFLYMKGLSGDEQIAEDITSETFFKAINALDNFKGRCDIKVWLCQIAKNCYFSYLRKNKNVIPADVVEEQDDRPDLEQSIANSEMSLIIHEILHNLTEPYKEVFTLRIFGELSFKQIAKLFGKTENWACVTYHRARNKIRERLED